MDGFLNIGGAELLVILIIAGIVMGPERILQISRWLGQTTAKLQNISRGFLRQLQSEIDGVDGEGGVADMLREMRDLQQEVLDLRQQVQKTTSETIQDTNKLLSGTVDEIQKAADLPSIQPPQLNTTETEPAAANGDLPTLPPSPPPEFEENSIMPPTLPNLIDVPDDPEN